MGHDDDRFHFEGASGVGNSLGVIAAGVGDDAALALVLGEGGDFVVGSAEFEGADRLLVFGLEVKAAGSVGVMEFDEAGAGGNAAEAGLGTV